MLAGVTLMPLETPQGPPQRGLKVSNTDPDAFFSSKWRLRSLTRSSTMLSNGLGKSSPTRRLHCAPLSIGLSSTNRYRLSTVRCRSRLPDSTGAVPAHDIAFALDIEEIREKRLTSFEGCLLTDQYKN